MIGRTIAHYKITGRLGKGGMGIVYRARDTRLDRDVALKVLPVDLAADPALFERFQREARVVAGLNHPHIVTLHSVEEDAGVHFLTMEVIEGQALDHVITGDGLPLAKVFDIGIAVADALAAAHDKGIVHRDLKPANVMLTKDGRVKVLDFGLAKLSDRSSSRETDTKVAPLTIEGTVMGTAPYMSPEQVRGQDVDHRSDIFSFGILLYEMASGRRPFNGATNADILSAVLTTTPPPITRIKTGLPESLGRIVAQCLEKEPEERYHSAKDIRNELRGLRREADTIHETSSPAMSVTATVAGRGRKGMWIGLAVAVVFAAGALIWVRYNGGPHNSVVADATHGEKTIAVLPFVNMSADPEQGYFSDGISEELLNLLSKVPNLRVAARTSSFAFKGQSGAIQEIGERLNVEYVLEGSVRRAGDQVRVTAQLIQVTDGFHVWSQTYDRKLDDIFVIQDEIAADVVKRLEVTLLGQAPTTRKTDPEAFAMYLRAVQVARQYTEDAFGESDSLLIRVLEIDSTYAPAWVSRGQNLIARGSTGLSPMEKSYTEARNAFKRALEIDPRCAPAYAGLAHIEMNDTGDLAAAARHLERAYALDPSDPRVMSDCGSLLVSLGRREEALALRMAQMKRDPINEDALYNLGVIQILNGRIDEGIATLRTLLVLSPGNGITHFQIGSALLVKGDGDGALREFEQETIEAFKIIGLPMAYHALGRKAEADAALDALISKHGDEAAGNLASVYAYIGDVDAVFKWLEKEYETSKSLGEINSDLFIPRVAGDPRWLPFLRKIGQAPEQLEKIKFDVAVTG